MSCSIGKPPSLGGPAREVGLLAMTHAREECMYVVWLRGWPALSGDALSGVDGRVFRGILARSFCPVPIDMYGNMECRCALIYSPMVSGMKK